MRWIFFFLLLCNLAAIAWHFLSGPKPPEVMTAPGAPLSAAVPEIRMLSEMPEPRRRPNPSEMAAPAVERSLCFMAGAFKDVAEAQQFIDRLAVLDVQAFVHTVELSSGEGYWVFLDPLANRDAARRRLIELQARGIDSYIIPRGALEDGISLGVFTRLDLAQARLDEMNKIGLAAKMQPIERAYRELWVMLGEGEQQKLGESAWLELLQENLSLQQRQNFCSDVASAKNFH
jgi:cell division septation protein DedD